VELIVLIVFLVVVVVAVAGLVAGQVIQNAGFSVSSDVPPPRRGPDEEPHAFDPVASLHERGGAFADKRRAGWPRARLTVDERIARIEAPFVTAEIDRDLVRSVRIVRSWPGAGVLFVADAGTYDGIAYWTFQPARLAAELERLGWPVG
jgi:hypothetical protein